MTEKKRYSRLSGGCAMIITTGKKRYITTGKKRYSCLSNGCAVLAITTGKKRYSRLSVGCAVLAITTGKKRRFSRLSDGLCCCIVFVVAGNFDYDRKKKKDTVVCWREIGSFFIVAGNFHYDRKKKRYITTGKKKDTVVCLMGARYNRKKKIQSSVWRVVLLYCVSFWFWREIGSFFLVAGNFYYDRKKRYIRLSGEF